MERNSYKVPCSIYDLESYNADTKFDGRLVHLSLSPHDSSTKVNSVKVVFVVE